MDTGDNLVDRRDEMGARMAKIDVLPSNWPTPEEQLDRRHPPCLGRKSRAGMALAVLAICFWSGSAAVGQGSDLCSSPTISTDRSGNWSDPSTWDPARLPSTGDHVMISAGHAVVYDLVSEADLGSLCVHGQLIFRKDINTRLKVGTLLVDGEGEVNLDEPEVPVPQDIRTEIVILEQQVLNKPLDQRTVVLPSTLTLHAPLDPEFTSATFIWSQISGPGPARFSNPLSSQTAVSFIQPGIYDLRVIATQDGEVRNSDYMASVVAPSTSTEFFSQDTEFDPKKSSLPLTYTLAEQCRMSLVIYDHEGRQVRSLYQGIRTAGQYTDVWDGLSDKQSPLGAGSYIVILKGGSTIKTKEIAIRP